jgi:ABC-2 type transport system permease protein
VGELRAYAAMVGGKVRSVASYRASFAFEVISNLASTILDLLTVFVLFRAAATVGHFSLTQAVLMAGLAMSGFVLCDAVVGNIDDLKKYVRAGTLDTILLRPLALLPQLIFMDLPIRKVLRVAFGLTVYSVALNINHVRWTPGKVLLAIAAPLGGAVFFGAIFVLSASLAFWWVDSGEIGNAFTYGGRDFTSYPTSVYQGWFRDLFAYALGFGFVAYQPALVLLGRPDPLGLPAWAGYAAPLVCLPATLIAALVWRSGVRHYRSTGS